jgi:hypothetical protein
MQIQNGRGSKLNHGKGNRILHPDPLQEKGGVGSASGAREGNRVLLASKEVSLVLGLQQRQSEQGY